jgi:HlyD family secretion protein
MKQTAIIFLLTLSIISCRNNKNEYDASGSFEAQEIIISAESTGVIRQFEIEEGQELTKGQVIGYIDTTQLRLKKKQLESQISAILSRNPQAKVQIAALELQLKQANRELSRVENLNKAGAATQKQLDDASSQVTILESQLEALKSSLSVTISSLSAETTPVKMQIAQLEDQIAKSRLTSPVSGTVLLKYANENEMAVAGKPLYKIADVSSLILRVYITGDQLPLIKLNQQVKVMVDNGSKTYKEYSGVIEWISSKSEFTPKTIQTKDERANLVYAVKIRVPNDGYLKIGMYGEVKFSDQK